MNSFLFPLLLTFLAGFSTVIGGLLGFVIKRENLRALSFGLGFSAGVMIYVSFMEILPKATLSFGNVYNHDNSQWLTILTFFTGMLISFGLDKIIPEDIHHDYIDVTSESCQNEVLRQKLKKTGVYVAMAIAIHNFPEGMATFLAAQNDAALGISIATAIAIHNIPEGMAITLPIYNATGSKLKAFSYTLISAMAEPLGAILAFFALRAVFNDVTFGTIFAMVAGVMVYISFDQLIPSAKIYGNGHTEILGITAGMAVMASSLVLF